MKVNFDKLLDILNDDPNIVVVSYKSNYLICRPRTGSTRETVLPLTITPKLAYLVGAILGDGYILKDKFRIGIEKGSEQYLKDVFSNLFNDLFGYRPKVSKIKNWWRIETKNKGLWLLLTRVFSVSPGKRRNIDVPPPISIATKEIKSYFLAGLLDTDGGKRGGGFGFTTASKPLNENTIKILKELDLNPYPDRWINKKYSTIYYGWRIKNKSELTKLTKTIPLKNQKRLDILSKLCRGSRVAKGAGS